MEIVHVRGRVVRGTCAYFMHRYEPAAPGGRGEELATVDTRIELDVDGRSLTVELAPDMESHSRGHYTGPLRHARDDWDSSFPFAATATLGDDDGVRATRFRLTSGEEIEVWGDVLETELASAGYRDAPSKNPTVIRARAIDVPVRTPRLVSPWGLGFVLILAAAAAVAFVPMGPVTPFARFWSLLALSIAIVRLHWSVIPSATSSMVWEKPWWGLAIMYANIAVYVTLLIPLGPAFPSWMDVFACALLGAQAFASLYVRVHRMRRLREVARRLALGRELGIVRALENRTVEFPSEVARADTLIVVFDGEERTIPLASVIFDSHAGLGPRPGTRVLVGNGALYASWEDPRAELEQIVLWDGRLRWASAVLALALPVITYLAYQAPRLSG